MSDTEQKTPVEYARDIIVQLKEMQHYAKTNAEKLSAQWLAFSEGEMKNKLFEEKLALLLNKQGAWVDELQEVINDIEIECNRIENEA